MNPTAVYSKSGKGVQEAAGKTSQLSRPDRAVLAAIDGRASLADVAQKVGRAFDSGFKQLIGQLDKDGFIREVSSGSAAAGAVAPRPAAARPAAKPSAPTGPINPDSDLDFTVTMPVAKRSAPLPPPQPPPRPAAPPPKINVPPPPPPPSAEEKAKAERIAREQQAAMAKAREEAERKGAEERDRVKSEAEAKARIEAEAKARAEAEIKARDAAAQAHAAREAAVREAVRAAAEAKAKAEAEVRRAKEETERMRREVEDERRKIEDERRQREEQARRQEAEQAMRRAREEEEERLRRRQRDEEEAAAADIRRKIEEKNSEHERRAEPPPRPPPPKPPPAQTGDAFADSLLADLDSFNTREEEEERKRQAEAQERDARQAAARRDEEARQANEHAERQKKDDKARQKEEKQRLEREEEERAAQAKREADERIAQEETRRKDEEEERKRRAKEEERLASRATQSSSSYHESVDQRRRKESQLFSTGRHRVERKKGGWGKSVAIVLAAALLAGLVVLHFMPISTVEYERAASQALGRRVKIGSANFSLFTGIQLKFTDVAVGDARIGRVRAFPELGTVLSERKAFSRIELEGLTVPQDSLGEALFARMSTGNFYVARVLAQAFRVEGALPLPALDGELVFGPDGAVRSASVRGPDGLVAKLVPKGGEVQFDMTATRFTLPIAQDITLVQFGMKGSATRNAMTISAWDGELYNGTLSGTARLRWGGTWNLEGAITARGVNAAVFAPALLSDGRLEGTGRFSMSGAEPAKLGRGGRLEGSFTVNKGVLGSFDLSRAIQTAGKESTGSTRFAEMNGQGVYDRGAVALRNVTIGAGALNAGASADIAQSGALSGRIVADVRTASQTLRATLLLGGTLKEPRVRN